MLTMVTKIMMEKLSETKMIEIFGTDRKFLVAQFMSSICSIKLIQKIQRELFSAGKLLMIQIKILAIRAR